MTNEGWLQRAAAPPRHEEMPAYGQGHPKKRAALCCPMQGRGLRQDESNSSSDDQTAYEGHQHSHASHSTVSHDGGAPSRGRASAAAALGSPLSDMHSPARAQKLVREIQEAVALLGELFGRSMQQHLVCAALSSGTRSAKVPLVRMTICVQPYT